MTNSAKKITVHASSPQSQKRIYGVLQRLCKSQTGQMLVEDAAKNGFCIKEDPELKGMGAACRNVSKAVHINPKDEDTYLTLALAHELRHAHQLNRGVQPGHLVNDTQTMVKTSRAMEADAVAHEVKTGYELFEAGDIDVWRMANREKPEQAQAYSDAVEKDTSSSTNGKALANAFEAWYSDPGMIAFYEKSHVKNLQKLVHIPEFKDNAAFARHETAEKLVEQICVSNTGNYFTDHIGKASILEDSQHLGIDSQTQTAIKSVMNYRTQEFGKPYDKTADSIPVMPMAKRYAQQEAQSIAQNSSNTALVKQSAFGGR